MNINEMLETTSPEQYRDRINTCNSCSNMNVLKMCRLCLCVTTVKAKLKAQSCPIDKWKKI